MTTQNYIQNKREDPITKMMEFTLHGVEPCYAVAISRIILTKIDIIGIVSDPYEKNKVNVIDNITNCTNEIVKHRLSAIPIFVDDITTYDYENVQLELNVENNTDTYMDVTTEHFRIIDKNTGKQIEGEHSKLFPKDDLTGDYILFLKLRPKLVDSDVNEKIHLKADFSICNAGDNSVYNVVSTCGYGFTPDKEKQMTEWLKKEKELKQNNVEDIDEQKKNWFVYDAKRHYKKNSYDFKIESIGVYKNDHIVRMACKYIIKKLDELKSSIQENKLEINIDHDNENSYEVKINNDNYTIGKIIEDALYVNYYKKGLLSYISYKKIHPHIDYGIIIIQFKDGNQYDEKIKEYFLLSIEYCKKIFMGIQSQI